jgi:hypothetical protein
VRKHGLKHGLTRQGLCEAIRRGWLPGEKAKGAGVDPAGHVFLVDENELLDVLASLPRCAFESCLLPAFRPSRACGWHRVGIEKRSAWWATDEGRAFSALLDDPAARDEVLRGRCWICARAAAPKAVAHVARAWREKRRRVCETCMPIWTGALGHVHAALVWSGADPAEGICEGNIAAIDKALGVARDYEQEIHAAWPAKPGRRLEVAVDLVIEASHRLDFTDESVERLFSACGQWVSTGYVKTRRKRARIHRRAA